MKSSKNSSISSEEEGNTISSSSKQISPCVCWCFTFNNYNDEIVLKFQDLIKKNCKIGFFNKEVGESGTPHLQGYIELLKKGRPLNLFPKGCHWSKAKGNKDANLKYCSKDVDNLKDMTHVFGIKVPTPIKIIDKLRPWQSEIENLLLKPPDERTINWVWEEVGNVGKSAFTKYLVVKHNALFIDEGKKADLVNLVFNTDMDETKIIVVDIPRDNHNTSYKTLEAIKNGLVCNTKYETGVKAFNSPHIIVFSNFYPDTSKLSLDRWNIKTINKENELKDMEIE